MQRRLFVAIMLPDETKQILEESIAIYKNRLPQIRWENRDKYHITLKFLGSTSKSPQDIIQAMQNRLDQISEFNVHTQGYEVLKGKVNSIALKVDLCRDLLHIYEILQKCFAELGFEKDTRQFHPHITIGRSKKVISTDILDQTDIRLNFVVLQIDLAQSITKPEGSFYRSIGTVRIEHKDRVKVV